MLVKEELYDKVVEFIKVNYRLMSLAIIREGNVVREVCA